VRQRQSVCTGITKVTGSILVKIQGLLFSRVTLSINFAGTHLYTWVERGTGSIVSGPRTQHNVPGQGLNPDCSIRRRVHNHEATAPHMTDTFLDFLSGYALSFCSISNRPPTFVISDSTPSSPSELWYSDNKKTVFDDDLSIHRGRFLCSVQSRGFSSLGISRNLSLGPTHTKAYFIFVFVLMKTKQNIFQPH